MASGPASERTLAAVGVELGYEAANPLIDQLLDPNLFAGVACLAGDFVDDGVGAVLQGASRAKGFVPNPNGRKGGAAHQAEVKWVEDDVRNRGFETIREFPVRIEKPDGTRTYRYIDVAAIDKQSNRPVEFHQVGRLTASGQPVSREWRVFSELSMYGGDYSDVPTWFHGYQP